MWLYGASGHGKVIKEILEAQGRRIDGFIDDNPNIHELAGLPVIHTADGADEVIVSIGVNVTRKSVVERLNVQFSKAVIHPTAMISPSANIGEGTVVMPGAIINAGAKIGKHCIINTGATIDHECQIGDYVHIAPGSHLCGQVHVGEGTLIGAGSAIIPCVKIGEWCVTGAGSVVINDIPDGYIAYGNPCKLIQIINQDVP